MKPSRKTLKKWELLSSAPVFASPWLTVEKRAYRLPSGIIGEDYYHLKRPDYVLVWAVNDRDEILIERQYRRGVEEFMYELPAGYINNGETSAEAARRELKEETGASGKVDSVFEIFPQPGFSSMKAFAVIVRVNSSGQSRPDRDEQIVTEWMSLEKINQLIKTGQIKDMGFLSVIAIMNARKLN